ncbi:MAG: phosphatase PAP2 family protein [candidate division WWE3 bacterium]|nr:phosphatase PAP2 family protein [candidate division WWE3 bacterium]
MIETLIIFIARWLIYVVIGITLAVAYFRWGQKAAARIGLTTLISFLVAEALKYIFNTPRPFVALKEVTPLIIFDPAFPSAHTATLVALGTVIFLKNKLWGIVILVIAMIVGASRVILQVHYPIDIFGGAIVGVIVGLFINYSPKIKLKRPIISKK